jgi:hypothetical protein
MIRGVKNLISTSKSQYRKKRPYFQDNIFKFWNSTGGHKLEGDFNKNDHARFVARTDPSMNI